ncbi:GTP-binding protein [Sedimentitalea sp.]|uniref:CobW family GTP-binding protein n=1 Tax=Sedimentitalea sp. TaxID=2048915 RepID=UPI003297ABA5
MMDLPVSVIGGYLGAGKTTLINHLLRHNEGQRLAVLVNEFGELPIDADLIEATGDGLISISGGCVCCAFGSDLIGALSDIQNMSPRPDHILIEASGVALPASIATTVGMIDGLRADATLVLADAEQIRRNANNTYLADTIERQLKQADILLLTKADLVSPHQLEAVRDWLNQNYPGKRILPVTSGQIPISAALGALPFPARRSAVADTVHGRFHSQVYRPASHIDAKDLGAALADDPGVDRAKGFIRTATGMALIHVVGNRYTIETVDDDHETGVVFIGLKDQLDLENIQRILEGLEAGNQEQAHV